MSAASSWVLPLLLALSASVGLAQSPSATPVRPPVSNVRFWNMLPRTPGAPVTAGELELLAGANQRVSTGLPANHFAIYTPLPPGSYNFLVQSVADPKGPPLRLTVPLKADTYGTVLVSEREGRPQVEWIDDTIDPKLADKTPTRLTVRQFIAGASVTVVADARNRTPPLGVGETVTLNDLPGKAMMLKVEAFVNGKRQVWSSFADFSTARRMTLLVISDPYGRFRPVIAVDGQPSGPAEPEKPEAASPASTPAASR